MSETAILHVVSYDVSRGAERYARALVDNLNRQGQARHLLMTMFRGDEDTLGVDHALDVPRGRFRSLGFDPRVVKRMRRVVQDITPSAVVAHGGEPAKYAAFALPGHIPYAYLVIGSTHPKLSNPIRRALRKVYLDRATAIVTVSGALRDDVVAERPSVEMRTHVIPNARDADTYKPDSHQRTTTPRVIFIGRLEEQKRPHLFLDTVDSLSRRGVTMAAMIVGDGPLREEVDSRAGSLGVDVVGSRGDVPTLLSSSDLLVVTSCPPEGLPGVLIEAGLCGVAVVTTDVPGARDVVEDDVTGIVVPVDAPEVLARAVETLTTDPERLDAMGRAAREHCLGLFTIDATVESWRLVIEGMMR
ncbi:MAG: glycosyltransferase family 4 protein [Acidimicrobiia bacterium]|jgi:glycosyltransferase involved in cell wall biosynthesis